VNSSLSRIFLAPPDIWWTQDDDEDVWRTIPLGSVHSKLEHQAWSVYRLVFYLTVSGLQ